MAEMTQEGSRQMAPVIGENVVLVEGVVQEVRGNQWDLLMRRVEYAGGVGDFWSEERVTFESQLFGRVEQRELRRIRTALAVGGGVVLALVLGRTLGSSGGGGDTGGGNGIDPPL
ncbi:MAG: hypothetical protein EA350_15780 [Gemmatimonadales bacterium]|nr:MAG: hypothetical protein EA350_15780 [Gemmatimonadales bacterium]